VVLFVILANLSYVWAQASLPVLRGVVVTPDGQGRAFFEDPTTGALGAYAVGDVIDGNRIEQIREDAVILRRGDEVIRILMGSAPDSERSPGSAPGVMPVYRPNPKVGPTIGNGQPWLDRLGIPPQALSQAIEEAQQSAQDAESDNLKD
jgi:hypothetical protein